MATYTPRGGAADSYDGPEWAAPESAARHMHRTEPHPTPPTTGLPRMILVGMLGDGQINPHQFQTAWALTLESDRETADWTEADWVAWEAANPE